MVGTVGTSTNTNDAATITSITLNSSTSVKILDAIVPPNPPHIKVVLSLVTSANVIAWIKLQAASVDDDKTGIRMDNKSQIPLTLLENSDIYMGEISAILDSGGDVEMIVTRF